MRVRVKICGITRPGDGVAAARSGADAIGLVFYPRSPRAVDAGSAAAVVAALPPFVTVVGLFVNPSPEAVSVREDASSSPLVGPSYRWVQSSFPRSSYLTVMMSLPDPRP